ncbi:glutathione synthase / RimK-type ligase, ATP-grasp superfamily [Campylobacter mucosalis]|uniref:ATP-grasp domain-containing protein n=1 Tax=Campylobacter mucosalis TaxID=202 RepID=UPI0015932DE0|nr:hypothetical protein [Campylobacter mucosalis]QKF63515.1 glutathione synthase / RimK-type ligase, ATP-grasp superfamily [Campylobacter mucosalis]
MSRIFILTCNEYPNGNDALNELCLRLSREIYKAKIIPWQKFLEQNPPKNSIILPLGVWDYSKNFNAFMTFLDEISSYLTLNEIQIIKENITKEYLTKLQDKLPTIPTEILKTKDEMTKKIGSLKGEFIIKPLVGQSGNGVEKIDKISSLDAYDNGAIIQPFIKEISQNGEICFVFFNSKFKYAIKREIKQGEFRANSNYGVTIKPILSPNLELLNMAKMALKVLLKDKISLYARVDIVPTKQGGLINEVELIEPSLYFNHFKNGYEIFINALKSRI